LILREIPFSAIEFPIYEYMKKKTYEENGGKELTVLQNARNGAVAGSIGIYSMNKRIILTSWILNNSC